MSSGFGCLMETLILFVDVDAILKKLLLYLTDFLSSYFFKILLKKLIDLVLTIYTCGIEKI